MTTTNNQLENTFYVFASAFESVALVITLSDKVGMLTKIGTFLIALFVGIYTISRIRNSNKLTEVRIKKELLQTELAEAELKSKLVNEKIEEKKLRDNLKK